MWEQLKRRASCQILPTSDRDKPINASRELNHPAFQSIRITQVEGLQTANTQTVVTLSKLVTPQAMQQCLQFVYTGTIDKRFFELQVCINLYFSKQSLINLYNNKNIKDYDGDIEIII